MEKAITTLLLSFVLSISVLAQNKKDSIPATALKLPPDSAKIISVVDLNTFIKYFSDNYSATYYNTVKPPEVIRHLYEWFIREYNAKPKKK